LSPSTIDRPAIISYFTPSTSVATNTWSGLSLTEERIRSAFEGAQRELNRYERYQPRWDGYDAKPFDTEVLSAASKILNYSEALFVTAGITPQLVTTGPASDGSLDVEFRVGDKRVLMTLYPHQPQIHIASFHARDANEYNAPLGTHTLAMWLSWLHRPISLQSVMAHNPVDSR